MTPPCAVRPLLADERASGLALGVCGWDTGSMYGCESACSRPAVARGVYRVPCYGPFTVSVCAGHVGATEGRVFPSVVVWEVSL